MVSWWSGRSGYVPDCGDRHRNVIRVAASFRNRRSEPADLDALRPLFDEITGRKRGMDWKRNPDALIESTMAFVKDVKREPIPDLPLALRTAEQALADTSKPITARATVAPTVWPASERDEMRQRVSNFKAHQEKMAREREDYYLQVKARMLAPVDPNPTLVHPTKNPTVPLRTL